MGMGKLSLPDHEKKGPAPNADPYLHMNLPYSFTILFTSLCVLL